ncbi:MAG: S8 family serine peptidase [candidate division Zixibacteria bacterium]|nr:S8 family serine peptidase [candidate division Zixibacteria bacterium]
MDTRTRVAIVAVVVLLSCPIIISPTIFAAGYQLKRRVAPKPIYTNLPFWENTDEIIFKLIEGLDPPELQGKQLHKSGADFDRLNEILARSEVSQMNKHFAVDQSELDDMRVRAAAKSGIAMPDLGLYFILEFHETASAEQRLELISDLNSLDIIEIAYFGPIHEEALIATDDNWEEDQNYLQAAPSGVNAYYGWQFPGGKGQDILVIDIEYAWLEAHEDVRGSSAPFLLAGEMNYEASSGHHGTAVLGEIAADSNTYGMTGIAHEVDLGVIGNGGDMDREMAVLTATQMTEPGDVILLEMQSWGIVCEECFVPVEYHQGMFDVILQATALDRIIVEAGANGGQNLDDTFWYDSLFYPEYRFSGALMVGAANWEHLPHSWSNHGIRMDLHGFGSNVYTTGYGDLSGSGASSYTRSFSGTSSASPIIAGACAILEGISKSIEGRIMGHNEMRTMLQTWSTPQIPHEFQVGPMPDLYGSTREIVKSWFDVDIRSGWVPLAVTFDAWSIHTVDTWDWIFGDGLTGAGQSTPHTYNEPGMYDVTLETDAGGEIVSRTRYQYVIALADTVNADTVQVPPAGQAVVTMSINNTVPISSIRVPFEYPGNLSLTRDSISVQGCRTDYFDDVGLIHSDAWNSRYTFKVDISNDALPPLDPGAGPILKIYFSISSNATPDQSVDILLDGYWDGSHDRLPTYSGPLLTYQAADIPGAITVLDCSGNPDDTDADCIVDASDNCPDQFNPTQQNSDADTYGDACDNCPEVTNPDQADADSDEAGDICDNCPSIANTDQQNADADTYGDACDNCPGVTNPDQLNSDTDSHGDLCDNCPTVDNEDQADSNGDNVGDACSGCCDNRGDFDHNGQVDIQDVVGWVRWAFDGDPVGPGCEDPPGFYPECDMDNSAQVDIGDIVYWVNWSFGGGDDPVPCP